MGKTKISMLIGALIISIFTCIGVQAEFVDSVNTVMSVRTANGEMVDTPEELSSGEYNVILNIGNLSGKAKQMEVYVAVKADGKLYSVKSRTTNLENKELMQIYPIEIPVTLKKDVSGKEISIEAYCWDDTMVPFNRKTVFGEADTEIYTAYGRITATPRTNDSLDYGEVKFCVEKSDNFDGVEYGSFAYAPVELNMYYANQEAYNEMFRYSKATIIKDVETENFTIVSLEYMDSESTVIAQSNLYEIASFTGDEITFYESFDSSKTTTYDLSDSFSMYVNGVRITAFYDTINAYIERNDSGTVTLIDATETGKTTTDGKVDYIFVDYYVDSIVDFVVDADEYKIYFANGHADVKTLKIDKADKDIYVRYILDGQEISHTDLNSGDVLSIAYDVTGDFSYSAFYDVLVSRDVVNGKVTSIGADNNDCEYYVINNQKYSPSKLGPVAGDTLIPGNHYILWLNAFGKFVDYEEDMSAKNIGIFNKAYIDSDDTPYISLITKDGEKVSYAVKDNSKSGYYEIASNFYDGNVGESLKTIENLLCEYTINSNGYITGAYPLSNVDYRDMPFEYKSSTNKLGIYTLSEQTKIIDLTSKLNDLTQENYFISKANVIKTSDLIDGNEYEVICAEKANSDGSYRYVVLLSGETGYVEPEDVITSYVGLFNKAYIDSGDNATIRVINEAGEKVSYTVKNNNKTLYTQIANQFYSNGVGSELKSMENLICEYSINSKGYIISATPLEDVQFGSVEEFDSQTNKIGQYVLSEDAVIINLTSELNNITAGEVYAVNSIELSDLIDGNEYEILAAGMEDSGAYKYIVLLSGETAYVEPADEIAGSYTGIFDKAYMDSGDIPWIRIITEDGEKVSYPVKYDNKTLYMEMAGQFYTGSVGSSELKPIQNLICTYEISSKGYIISVIPMDGVGMATTEYLSDTKAFGAYELAEEAVILDVSSISNWLEAGLSYDISVIQKKDFDELVNNMTYEVVVSDKNEEGKYNFAVILSGGNEYTANTPIAVYNTRGSEYDDIQGASVDTLEVYINGNDETVALKVAPGTNVTLNRGDVFLYKTDSNGYVDSVFKLFDSADESSYSWFMENMTPANMGYKDVTSLNGVIKSIPVLSSMPDDWINTDATTKTGEVDLVYGVITDKRGQNVSLAQIERGYYVNNWGYEAEGNLVNKDLARDYTICPDANVYIYDYSEGKVSNRLYSGITGSIQKSIVPDSECIDYNGYEAFTVLESDGYMYRELNFLFGKVVDGEITECLVILGSY